MPRGDTPACFIDFPLSRLLQACGLETMNRKRQPWQQAGQPTQAPPSPRPGMAISCRVLESWAGLQWPVLPSSLAANKQRTDVMHMQFRRESSWMELWQASEWEVGVSSQSRPPPLGVQPSSDILQPCCSTAGAIWPSRGGQAPPALGINLNTLAISTERALVPGTVETCHLAASCTSGAWLSLFLSMPNNLLIPLENPDFPSLALPRLLSPLSLVAGI